MPRLLDLRYRLEYYALRGVAGFIRSMPLETAANFSAAAWGLIAPRLRRHSRALANLAIAYPEKSVAEREAIARAMWQNLGRVMAETMQIDRIIADPSRIEIVTPMFQRYKDKLGAAVGVSLHTGNWELAIWPLTVAGANPAAVYRSVKNPYVDQYLRDMRRDLYPGGLIGKGITFTPDGDWFDNGLQIARVSMEHVRRGGRIGIVSDLHDRTGIPVDFFGTPARSVALPAVLARRLGARIWLARCIRVGDQSRFRIELKELRVPRSGSQADDVREITATMQKAFEAWIREYPEQWMWSNRRWS